MSRRNNSYRHWLVLWSPRDPASTINEMKVIDAWSGTGGISAARDRLRHQEDEYTAKHGKGLAHLVEQHADNAIYLG